jgi:hypothetical protein
VRRENNGEGEANENTVVTIIEEGNPDESIV